MTNSNKALSSKRNNPEKNETVPVPMLTKGPSDIPEWYRKRQLDLVDAIEAKTKNSEQLE